MAIPHAQPGEIIDISPLGTSLAASKTHTLAKTDDAELIRLVLPKGKELATHKAPGQIIVQCLEGRVTFTAMGSDRELAPGQLLYLLPGEPHSLRAVEDASVLLTILFPKR